MNNKTLVLVIIISLLFNSCAINSASYHISGTHEFIPSKNTERKWIINFENFSSSVEQEVKSQIVEDFKDVFQSNVEFNYQFLDIDNSQNLLSKIDSIDLNNIKHQTNAEMFAVFKIEMKYELPQQIISIKKGSNQKYQNMFIYLDVYDLRINKLIYTKYGSSQLKINETEMFVAQTGVKKQATKTYLKLKNDFFNFMGLK